MSQSLKMEIMALENPAIIEHTVRSAARKQVLADSWRWLASAYARVTRAMAKRRRQRRAIAELERLDDRLLKDIGISRSEIPYVVGHGREASHGWL